MTEAKRQGAVPGPDEVIAALRESRRGPVKPKDLARLLDVPQAQYRAFRELLRRLEQGGELYRVKGNRYAIPDKINLVVGTLQITRSGDAFLRPDQPRQKDLFIPAANLASGMDGDRVTARIESRPRGLSAVGRVLKVLDRAHPTIVGTFHRARNLAFVAPLDPRLSRDVLLPGGEAGGAREGDVVVVRIVHFGDRRLNAGGEIERVLGGMEDPGVDVLAILYGHGLKAEFPSEVETAAREAAHRLRTPGERKDHKNLHVFTIDPSDAKDHDDALSVTPAGPGTWEVGVHIADVSHFVEEGSPLDLEAFHRGTSVYLVDQVVPMLPHHLSSDLCSLRKGTDRLAVSLFLRMDEEGRVRGHRFERSWIRCAHALDYDLVQDVLSGQATVDEVTDDALRTLDRLAKALRGKRKDRGSLDFDLPEARVILDAEGAPVDILRRVQMDSHRLIEDFMILANEVVAREAESRGLPIPFRIHEPPAEDRGDELRAFLNSIGHSVPKGKLRPKILQEILSRTEGRPEGPLVSTVVLKSMTRARYDAENLGHFGLASKAYTHFTSPIRRYPDLALHRVVVRSLVQGREPHERWGAPYLDEMTARSSERERIAQKAERDSVELKKVEFMRRHLGSEFDGTISGVTTFGFFVLLDRFFVEGLVHVSALGDDYYVFQPESYTLAGTRTKRRYRLSDRVRIQVARVSKEERRIDFLLVRKLV
ncbi:MAG: ribonuclease R [Gemmatimonadota bacterium]